MALLAPSFGVVEVGEESARPGLVEPERSEPAQRLARGGGDVTHAGERIPCPGRYSQNLTDRTFNTHRPCRGLGQIPNHGRLHQMRRTLTIALGSAVALVTAAVAFAVVPSAVGLSETTATFTASTA